MKFVFFFFLWLQTGGRGGKRGGPPPPKEETTAMEDVDLRVLVHQSQAGCIIGKGGGKVKELREVNICI